MAYPLAVAVATDALALHPLASAQRVAHNIETRFPVRRLS